MEAGVLLIQPVHALDDSRPPTFCSGRVGLFHMSVVGVNSAVLHLLERFRVLFLVPAALLAFCKAQCAGGAVIPSCLGLVQPHLKFLFVSHVQWFCE